MVNSSVIRNIQIKIIEEEVYRYLGYSGDAIARVPLDIKSEIKNQISQAYSLLDSRGVYRLIKIISISAKGDIFTEQGDHFWVNKDIVYLLKNVEWISFALVTIGEKIEENIRKKFDQNQSMQAVILDAVGTVSVKMVGQWLNHYLEKEISQKGYQLSRYFEPGAGDWDLQEQQTVFEILKPKKIGVRLSDHFMMVPAKSLSWMRGVGHHLIHSYRHEFSCRYCLLGNCPFRKES